MADPLYRQIADDLRRQIETGELAGGERLPTELELRERYDVSRNTIRDATRYLILRGLIETRPGQGTFVVTPIEPFITVLGPGMHDEASGFAIEVTSGNREPMTTAPRVEIWPATGMVARELQLEERQAVVSRHQERYIDGVPWSLQTTFYPMLLAERGAIRLVEAAEIPEGTLRYLEDVLGVRQEGVRDTIAVRTPDKSETSFFRLPDDGRVPVLEVSRTGYGQDGNPLRLTVTVYPADRNALAISSGTETAGSGEYAIHGEGADRSKDAGEPGSDRDRHDGPASGDRQDEPVGGAAAPVSATRSLAEIVASLAPGTRYFLSRAGLSGHDETSWLFDGRAVERERIAAWLLAAGSGLLVITGRAGSGKSALLADVLVRSLPDLREEMARRSLIEAVQPEQMPPDWVFDAILHVGGLTVPQITHRLVNALGERLDPSPFFAGTELLDPEHLAGELVLANGACTIVIDGLDEAADPLGAVHFIGRLRQIRGLRFLIGTRASAREHLDAPAGDQDILDALAPAPEVLELTHDPEVIYRYARRYLRAVRREQAGRGAAASMSQVPDAGLDRAAAAVAGRSEREFLFARLAVHEIAADPRLLAPELAGSLNILLDGGYQGLFAAAVDRFASEDERYARLLETLAQARGRGLSESDWIWAAIAAAPRPGPGPPPEPGPAEPQPSPDAAWAQLVRSLLRRAAPYLTVDDRTGDGEAEAAYRFAHRTFAQFLAARDTEGDQQHLPAFDRATSADVEGYVREFAGSPPAMEAALQEGRLPCSAGLASQSPELARLAMRLWRLTSVHSSLHHRLLDAGTPETQEPEAPLTGQQQAPPGEHVALPGKAGPARSAPQQEGARLERSVVDLLERLFEVDEDDGRELRAQIRRQRSGTQYGADVVVRRTTEKLLKHGISFRGTAKQVHSTCLVECKNYTSPVTMRIVSDKVLQAEMSFRDETVDHWILISPHEDPNNELDLTIQHWNASRKFPFTVHVWSPQTGIRDLFAVMPEVYRDLYGADPPSQRRDPHTVLADFAARLQPRVRLPERLAAYIGDPRSFVRSNEMGWLDQIGSQVKRFGFDESGARLPRPLEDEIVSVLCGPPSGSNVALLLADFGEGKSFFTVSLCVQLRDRYLADPGSGAPIPVRLLLQGFRQPSSATDFLRTQLERTGLSMQDWSELQRRGKVLVILDGLDEMSVRQDPATTRANLEKIESLLGELDGLPVLVTSRPHFLAAAHERERFYDRLRRPRVFRMSQPDRWDIVTHLRAFADTPELAQKLGKIAELHDPVGLASKMLFLQMTKETLPRLPEDRFDEVTLYNVYITQALERKIDLLRDPDSALEDRELKEQLLELLEKIAVAIHVSGEGCVDLLDFTAEAGGAAWLLWKAAQADELPAGTDEDAVARISTRSLLRRVTAGVGQDAEESWLVDFFHRSMKEYFVAKALQRALQSPDPFGAARLLLVQVPVQPEILGFFRLLAGQVAGAADVLARIARSAGAGSGLPLAGGGAISLYAAAGGRTRGGDWRFLNLDGALLSGADLGESDLRGSTLRGADLSSADLTNADLRGCDLTQANLAAGGSIIALAPDAASRHYICLTSESALGRIDVNADGSLRYTFIRLPRSVQSPQSLFALDQGLILVAGRSEFVIVRAEGGTAEEVTRFRISAALRAVAVVGRSQLGLVLEPDSGQSEALLAGIDDGQVAWRIPVRPHGQAYGWSADGVVIAYDSGMRAYRCDGRHSGPGHGLRWSGRSLSVHGGTVIALTADGQVAWLDTDSAQATFAQAHNGVGTAVTVSDGTVLSAGADGSVVLFRRDPEGVPVVLSRLERRLRCAGAKVDGLRQERERIAFLANGADISE